SNFSACTQSVSQAIRPVVTDSMNDKLAAPPSQTEISEAVFGLGGMKTPGPDGFSGFFFQKHLQGVEPSIRAMVEDFFATSRLQPNLNKTNLILIPKTQHPTIVTQYRPISLCNFNYKIIAKVLANRLKTLLSDLIYPNQSAFIPERLIQDNIIIAHEL